MPGNVKAGLNGSKAPNHPIPKRGHVEKISIFPDAASRSPISEMDIQNCAVVSAVGELWQVVVDGANLLTARHRRRKTKTIPIIYAHTLMRRWDISNHCIPFPAAILLAIVDRCVAVVTIEMLEHVIFACESPFTSRQKTRYADTLQSMGFHMPSKIRIEIKSLRALIESTLVTTIVLTVDVVTVATLSVIGRLFVRRTKNAPEITSANENIQASIAS
jgi:hypothetical protein